MKLHLITVGKSCPTWVNTGYAEYAKRLNKMNSLQLHEIPVAKRTKTQSIQQCMIAEGLAMMAAIPPQSHVVTLDRSGKTWSTEDLASQLADWRMLGSDVSLLIGGPDGLANDCLQRAQQSWALSKLTLPHPLVRVIVAEQLYRAQSILQNHPYHK